MGTDDLRERLRRAIIDFGHCLKAEASTKSERIAACLIKSRSTALRLAHAIIERLGRIGPVSAHINTVEGVADQHYESNDENDEEYPEDDASQMEREFHDLAGPLLESSAYESFKLHRLDIVNLPYEARIHALLEGSICSASQAPLPPAALSTTAAEMSWVPPKDFSTLSECSIGWCDDVKAWIEDDVMKEQWDWWPLAPRQYKLKADFQRLAWPSPSGTIRHLDLPRKSLSALMDVLANAPPYLNHDSAKGGMQHQAGATGTITKSDPVQPPPVHLPSHGSKYTNVNIDQAPNCMSNISQISFPEGTLYFSVQTGDTFDIVELREQQIHTDRQFFATLNREYRRLTRKRRWLSMWQYDHCDFALFSKYACDTCAFVKIDFPSKDDLAYDFKPRPIAPSPPHGPITKHEFHDRFYKSCEDCHSWHWHRRKMLRFKLIDRDAVDRLPKRKAAIDLADGKREEFWGLIARERRIFARVLLMCGLWNIPSGIFFWLWIFKWDHPADLQNAIVPMTVTLAITGLYVVMIYEDREGNK
ncbi:hypothetical protein HII31_12379 [Pseudocercospora fuligena]|uniref:Uncharacterized protein n=1 Tax=Pseudocercospora fuligena TaxID=685502 RepID=A0A8H6R8F9_9PEZI|nr:hypothetical protein HII31_12379 [Pseudocercospora fuligena]